MPYSLLRGRAWQAIRRAARTAAPMKIELLYFDGCPSYDPLLLELQQLLEGQGLNDKVELRLIESLDLAEEERFLGSPTLRINGEDIDPAAANRSDFGLKCRLYRSDEGVSGVPPKEWIIDALRRGSEASTNE